MAICLNVSTGEGVQNYLQYIFASKFKLFRFVLYCNFNCQVMKHEWAVYLMAEFSILANINWRQFKDDPIEQIAQWDWGTDLRG